MPQNTENNKPSDTENNKPSWTEARDESAKNVNLTNLPNLTNLSKPEVYESETEDGISRKEVIGEQPNATTGDLSIVAILIKQLIEQLAKDRKFGEKIFDINLKINFIGNAYV